MYSGFNLKINAERDCGPDSINFLDPGYIKTGETHLGDVSGKVNQELENMVLKGTDIPDGVAIQNDWFPEIMPIFLFPILTVTETWQTVSRDG